MSYRGISGHRGGESAIETTTSHPTSPARSRTAARTRVALAALLAAAALLSLTQVAWAGQSATGELAFHPCTQCHPVTIGANGKPTKPLPIGLEQHQITLEVHDILGSGDKACVVCHDDPARNPGKLILADGSLVDITGEVSRVCQRCHFEKFREWEVGIHGNNQPKCSAAGCHDPHTPSWIYMAALPPFQGTGVEIRAVGFDREAFKPLAGPPVAPPVYTPTFLVVLVALGAIVIAASVGYLVVGRSKR